MIRKLLLSLVGVAAFAGAVWASTVVYSANMVSQPALAVDTNFQLDLKTAGDNGRSIDEFSAQAIYSSATVPTVSFNDGALSSGTITVASVSNLSGVLATDSITVVSTTNLLNAIVTINGKQLRQGYDWLASTSSTQTATNLAAIMTYIAGINATSSANVISLVAESSGTAANAYTLAVSTPALTIAGATFSGGVDNAAVNIAGTTLTQGTDWTKAATTTGTAKAISDAVVANSTLNAVITSTWNASSQVRLTYRTVGVNAAALSATPALSLVAASTGMVNGQASAYTINTGVIHSAAHGFGTGLAVLFSTGGIAIGGLTNQTTYYAIKVDVDNFELASTSTGAAAGSFITLTSSSTTGPHTNTLSTLAVSGTFSFKWQYSNDGTTWLDVSVSSVTFASPYTATSTSWDFGSVDYRYLRVKFLAGTRGAVNLVISGYGKNDN